MNFEYSLEMISGAQREKHVIELPCVVGRGDDVGFTVKDASVSKQHAKILKQGEDVVVIDLKSANGTYVNGKRVEARILNSSDMISFASVQCRFIASPLSETPDAESPVEEQGAETAAQAGYEEVRAEGLADGVKQSLPEKLIATFDKWFIPFYRKTFAAISFPTILIPLVVGVFIVLVALTLSPQLEQNQRTLTQEAQKRAQILAKRLLDINRTFLDQDKDHLLRVVEVMDEDQVIDAFIAKSDGKIIAPERRYGQLVSTPQALRAVKSDYSYIESFGAFNIIAAEPVYRYSSSKGKNEVYAIAVVTISTRAQQLDSSGLIVLWLQILLFVIASGVLVSFLFIRIFTQPWKDLEDQIELALQKEAAEIPLVMNFGPVKKATKAINSALFKAQSASTAMPVETEPPKPEITYLEVSELGEILTRSVHEKDTPWVGEKIQNFESAARVEDIDPQLSQWFESQKPVLDNQASVSKELSVLGSVVTCYRRETLYILVFSHLSDV